MDGAGAFGNLGMCPATLLVDPMTCEASTFRASLEACASAGFDSVSLWPMHAIVHGLDETSLLLSELGLGVGCIEACTEWVNGDSEAARAEASAMLDTAERFGGLQLMAVTMAPAIDAGAATDGLAALCAMAADRGRRVALEFLPWSGVPTIASAWRIVRGTGADNAGLVIDTWHWHRQPGGPDIGTLRTIPGSRIHYVQLCDAAADGEVPGTLVEAMSDRRLPGSGAVDFTALLSVLRDLGAEPYVAAEVFNASLAAKGAPVMARAVHDACRSVLA